MSSCWLPKHMPQLCLLLLLCVVSLRRYVKQLKMEILTLLASASTPNAAANAAPCKARFMGSSPRGPCGPVVVTPKVALGTADDQRVSA